MKHNNSMKQENENRIRQIGLNIAFYRRMKRISQDELSARAGITRQWLAEIESPAKVSMPSVDTLLCIADALEIPPAKLFEFKEIEA